ncbi:MAG: ABC transporter substrate-binding protein [Acidimicrobiales bacterium]|nr:ABC transporter substrate-binding protein [Acidimicrobiales bacterium]
MKLLALIMGLSLVAGACGSDDDEGSDEGSDEAAQEEGVQGGELVDLGTFAQGPPEHIDPGINTTSDGWQVGGSLYDGLAETDFSDPENPETVPVVAESWEVNDDATEFVFTIREGLKFSDGEDVLPSSFVRGWERASDPEFAGDYSYLFTFIEGGAEKLDGEADTISGVEADDDAMTLTVTLAEPYANFPAVAGFQTFMPMPSAVDELDDQSEWERGIMIGNGPFIMAEPANDQEIVLEPNPEWDGTQYDESLELPEQPYLDTLRFVIGSDLDTAYNAFEAGEGDVTNFAPGRYQEAQDNYETTIDTPFLGAYYFMFNDRNEIVGGPENKLLRQAISQAIDREDINTDVYEGSRTTATGITPPGIPGMEEGLCDYCEYDPDAAEEAYQEWLAEGNELTEPLPIQFNADAGHEPVVQIIIDNLAAIGIEAESVSIPSEDYFGQLAEGACVFCRVGWLADYPTYDNFTFDIFGTEALDGNNYGYSNPEFDELVAEAKATTDIDEASELFRQAEQVLLNDDIGVVPINWYNGQQVYNGDKVAHLFEEPTGHVVWETVSLTG